jgi:tRNA/rRNA methyltransferase
VSAPLLDWRVVLVSPSSAENVGAVARAMRNFGCEGLCIVEPRCDASADGPAGKLARFAKDILANRREFPTLEEALADTAFSAALTRRGSIERPLDFVGFFPDGEPWQPAITARPRAIVLGREDDGLSTIECALCTIRWAIPATAGQGGSLNLGQAAAVALAGLAAFASQWRDQPPPPRATHADIDGLVDHVREMMESIDFGRGVRLEHNTHSVRLLANNANLTPENIRLLRGICRRVMNKVQNKSPTE